MEGLYTPAYYTGLDTGASRSAGVVVPLVTHLVAPRSVIDVGCGTGAWLAAFQRQGVEDVVGVDGPWVEPDRLPFPPERFHPHDLTKPFRLDRSFDLVVSLEVAEHLPPEAAAPFVDTLTGLGPVVLFSGAVPLQGGTGHYNEQWPAYWAALFEERGYVLTDAVRPAVWDDERVEVWYALNTYLFVAKASLAAHPQLAEEARRVGPLLPVIHPRMYAELQAEASYLRMRIAAVERLDTGTVTLRRTLTALPRLVRHAVAERVRKRRPKPRA